MTYTIATIVEGHGDVQALPTLLRRLFAEEPGFGFARPIRAGRAAMLDPEKLPKYLSMAEANIREMGGRGAILLLLDADDDCAAQLGPDLGRSVSAIAGARPVRVVLAVREFETWILGAVAAIESPDTDALGAAKDRLRSMHGRYSETADQARLIAKADLDLLRTRSRSFRKLLKTLDELRDDAALQGH
ncbi:MAG: DUF4276 family protein [Phycisphaerales bacterium]|nr:DUF4276 family protein [Phycisphaerales bacterium]